MSWTDERVELLKSLWTEGISASQIARVLGEVTSSAVIGKVHRLGLAGRVSQVRSDLPKKITLAPKVSLRSIAPSSPPAEEKEPDPIVLDDGGFATLMTINDQMCRWPIGDPSEETFHYCGRRTKGKSPYCEAHSNKAFQPKNTKRKPQSHRSY